MVFTLHPAYPNPSNPVTTLRYELPDYGPVKLTVYDINGHAVCELVNTAQHAGEYSVVWNGRDGQNQQVSSGIYICRLETNTSVQSRKMLLLK